MPNSYSFTLEQTATYNTQASTHPKAIKGIKAPLCSFTDSDAWRKRKMYKTLKVHVLLVFITSILMDENEDNSCSFQEVTERLSQGLCMICMTF